MKWNLVWMVICLAVQLGAQPRLGEFLSVKGWQGTITVQGKAVGLSSAFGSKDDWRVSYTAQVNVKLDTYSPFGQFWSGLATGTAILDHQDVLTSADGCTVTTKMIGTGAITGAGGNQVFLYAGPGDQYSFVMIPTNVPVKVTVTTVCGGTTSTQNGVPERNWWPDIGRTTLFPFPATGLALIRDHTAKIQMPLVLFTSLFSGQPPPEPTVNVHWDLKGIASELELIIEPQSFDSWRPEAGKNEKVPGNDLSIKATLQYADGTPLKPNDKAQKMEFQLIDVSKEPGITMNFPLKGVASSDPDLQFDAPRNAGLPLLVKDKDQAESTGAPHETATAIVSAYDWGAWGTVKVTAVTVDGRRIVGYLKGDKSQTAVRLPKRSVDSKIADVWKQQTGVNKPDNDDSEKEPVGLKNCEGDGLTLYEEYRGFQEKGKHIEGNPNKKDLFIRNDGGSVLEPGIDLYADISGMEVHKDLNKDEFNSTDRAVNANTQAAPHRVLQHGLWMKVCPGTDGGATRVTNRAMRDRPGTVTFICIQPPDVAGSSTNLFNLAPGGVAVSYEKTVAHELLHGSGVDHHGDTDIHYNFTLIPAGLATNTRGRAYYEVGGGAATVRDEKTGEDLAERDAARAESDLARTRAAYDWMVAQGWIERGPLTEVVIEVMYRLKYTRTHYVGRSGGEHSGDDQCVMRYFFAENYPSLADDTVFFKVPPGTEPSGVKLCANPAGSGVNADGRSPQGRYSDSSQTLGCGSWVCINDAIPPGAH